MEISITIEGQFGLNWEVWQRTVALVESLGYAGLYRSDHFMVGKTGSDSLELITSLTYLADHSRRLHFGSLVAPLSVHNPSVLARQAMTIDALSSGRMILGVGAGWHEPEHEMFGFTLGDTKTRLDRFEEGVQVMHALIHGPWPASFAGRHFHLKDAELQPRSRVRLLIGGNGPTRTLPLVARYADVWNAQLVSATAFKEVNQRLDGLIAAAGRDPGDVKRTVIVPVVCWRHEADLDRHVALFREHAAPWRDQSHAEVRHWLLTVLGGAKGTPQQVVDELGAYFANGAEEVIVEWFSVRDLEGIDLLGRDVVSAFRRA